MNRLFRVISVSGDLPCRVVKVGLISLMGLLLGCSTTDSLNSVEVQPSGKAFSDISNRSSAQNTFVYQCTDDYQFVARLEDDSAWLFLPGKTLQLKASRSASGAHYESASVSYWSQGEEATLKFDGHTYMCRNERRKAVWEAAKLNGYDFRGVGNEPGWVLEMGQGSESVLMTDYGQRKYTFQLPPPENEVKKGVTLYRIVSQEIEIIIENIACEDSMNGERFETMVRIEVMGENYRGCGRALH